MTLDNLSGGLYLEDVTGPVTLCKATSYGAWLTSNVTPPVVFCHLCSLTRESKCGRQVFSQHMILKIAMLAVKKETQQFWFETACLGFL